MQRVIPVVLAILLTPLSAHASADLHRLAEQAIALSGTRLYVTGVGTAFDKQLADDPHLMQMPPAARATALAALRKTFDGKQVLNALAASLVASGDAKALATAIRAMHDPVYQKINLAMISGNQALTEAQVAAYAATLESHAPDPARVQLVRGLDDATDSSQIFADTRYALAKSMLDAHAGADARDTLDSMRNQFDNAARNNFLVRTLMLSAKLDPAEFAAYVRVNQDDSMRWLSKQLGYGTQRAIADSMRAMAQIEKAALAASSDAATAPPTR
jgi:hypothetical protein